MVEEFFFVFNRLNLIQVSLTKNKHCFATISCLLYYVLTFEFDVM